MNKGTLQIGIDALDFVGEREGGWDCVVWDSPYWNGKKDRGIRLNGLNRLNSDVTRDDKIFFGDPKLIEEIKYAVSDKLSPSGVWIVFHSDPQPLDDYNYEHVWFKGDGFGGMGAGYRTRNDEYVYLKFWGKPKINRFPGLPRVLHYQTGKSFGDMPRRAYKPKELFKRIFQHVNATKILDPFAGWGDSIRAAYELGIGVDACDIDTKLNWDDINDNLWREQSVQTSLVGQM